MMLGSILCGAVLATALSPAVAPAGATPDALTVEWNGQHPCEKLYEDAQIRVARCTFPPGSVHVRHSHPGYLTYGLSGGKGRLKSAAGEREVENRADTLTVSPPIAWHEYSNTGDTTVRYLVIEKKYEPAPPN
jgi:quercetin dioxygenase-like cupin family protein